MIFLLFLAASSAVFWFIGLPAKGPAATIPRMGTFYTGAKIENVSRREQSAKIPRLLVDTGSEYTWVSGRAIFIL